MQRNTKIKQSIYLDQQLNQEMQVLAKLQLQGKGDFVLVGRSCASTVEDFLWKVALQSVVRGEDGLKTG